MVHMGAHGTLEWLPGKAVALTAACFPEAVVGALPVFYPFLVSNPGEAAQAKRRIAAVTIGHLPPPLVHAELGGPAQELERLVDEYAIADGLDRRRRERLARLIVETARRTGLAREAGVESDNPDEALRKIDAWLCDLKDIAIKDGLHVFGRMPEAETIDPAWQGQRGGGARGDLLTALDGKRVKAGPAGAPQRGRRDVLPTGRNLYTADPRMLPTQTAMELGRLAADDVIRLYLQTHGEMPRSLVIDLWGSATLRTGGEEIAQGLALMGCRPIWDTGKRARHRHRGPAARRDGTPARRRDLAHFRPVPRPVPGADRADRRGSAAGRASATRTTTRIRWPPRARLAATMAARCSPASSAPRPALMARASRSCSARTATVSTLGAAYLAATSHGYGGADGEGTALPGRFADRVATRRSSPARQRRSFARSARRRRGCGAYRRLRRGCRLARTRGRSGDARHDRSQPAARAHPRCGAGQDRARPRRSIRASSKARCGTARAARRSWPRPSTGWSISPRRPAPCRARCSICVHDAYLADPRVREFPDAREPRSRARHRRHGWRPRGARDFGIRAATISARA